MVSGPDDSDSDSGSEAEAVPLGGPSPDGFDPTQSRDSTQMDGASVHNLSPTLPVAADLQLDPAVLDSANMEDFIWR
ncbi:hypothetical protein HK405_007180, partial [Cladochytrium tenue]